MGCTGVGGDRYRVATLNFSGICLSPFEYHDSSIEKDVLSCNFYQKSIKENGKFKWELGKIDQKIQKQRYTPIYRQNVGIQKGKLITRQQFDQYWNEYFKKLQVTKVLQLIVDDTNSKKKTKQSIQLPLKDQKSQKVIEQSLKNTESYQKKNQQLQKKNQKSQQESLNKQKKDLTKQQKNILKMQQLLKTNKNIIACRQFDFVCYQTFVCHVYGITTQIFEKEKKQQEKLKKINSKKYKTFLSDWLQKPYLNNIHKLKQVVKYIKSKKLDVVFLQQANIFYQDNKKWEPEMSSLKDYKVIKGKCQSVIIYNNQSISSVPSLLSQQQIKNFQQKYIKSQKLNWNNDSTCVQINSVLLISAHLTSKKNNIQQGMQMYKTILNIKSEYKEMKIVIGIDANHFMSEKQIIQKIIQKEQKKLIEKKEKTQDIKENEKKKDPSEPKQVELIKQVYDELVYYKKIKEQQKQEQNKNRKQKNSSHVDQYENKEKVKKQSKQIPYFYIYPETKKEYTTIKKRTSIQPQTHKANQIVMECKDHLISSQELFELKIKTINGETIQTSSKDSIKGQGKSKPYQFLPNEKHPFDHFLVESKIRISKHN